MTTTTTTTTTIEIGTFWSTFKTSEDKLWLVQDYTKGWYAVEAIDDDAQTTGETMKLRAKDFHMQYEFNNGEFYAIQPMSIFEGPEAIKAEIEILAEDTEITTKATKATKTRSANPMAMHIQRYATSYQKVKTANCHSKICGDELSILMMNYSLEVIVKVASIIKAKDLEVAYAGLNNGQKRMNAGNIIRNALKNGIATIADLAGMFEQTKIGM